MKYRAYELIHHRKYDITKPHMCPVCGQHEFPYGNSFLVCPVCDWMDDGVQEDYPDMGGCANRHSLNWNRKRWADKMKKDAHTTIRKMEQDSEKTLITKKLIVAYEATRIIFNLAKLYSEDDNGGGQLGYFETETY